VLSIQSKTWSSFLSSLAEWAQNSNCITTIRSWLDLKGRKCGPLDFKSCFNLVQWFMKIRVSELVVGSDEPDKCLEEKKIAKVFILSLMSTHDFWNVHIHTQQSKLLQNKQWKKENIYQLRQSKFDHKIKNPKSVEIFHFFVGNFYVHNSILVWLIFNCYFDIIKEMYDSKVCSQKYLVSLVFLKLLFPNFWKRKYQMCSGTNQKLMGADLFKRL